MNTTAAKPATILDVEVEIRALTDAEMAECADVAGDYPQWGAVVEERIGKAAASYIKAAEALPPEWRLTEEQAHAKAMAWLKTNAPEDFEARRELIRWNITFAEEVARRGLVSPAYADIDLAVEAKGEFVATVANAVVEMTQAAEGKE